jgi:Family of unknown function (DUF5683)
LPLVIIFCLSLLHAVHGCAQAVPDTSLKNIINDTVRAAADTHPGGPPTLLPPVVDTTSIVTQKIPAFQPNPKKAGLYSAIVPGLGQLYNRQYWKIPVVYAGAGIAAYFITKNLKDYQTYRKAYIGRINNPYPTDQFVGIYTTDQLQTLQNDYEKYLDLAVLFSGIGFAMQIMDAVTSAHLKNFDISRDISLKIKPVGVPGGMGIGVALSYHKSAWSPADVGYQ